MLWNVDKMGVILLCKLAMPIQMNVKIAMYQFIPNISAMFLPNII